MEAEFRKTILESLRALLRPIVRFCLKRSIKVQDAIEVLKQAFIEVSTEELNKQNEKLSTSRLSIMTGLHRRDVVRLTSEKPTGRPTTPLLTRIIGQWQQDRRFCKKSGEPSALSIEGKESEFVDLVQSVSKDLNAYTVLFELERLGSVERDGDTIRLRSEVYVPTGDLQESLGLLAGDLDDLVASVDENVFERPEVPNLHIKTEYDNICVKDTPALRRWILEFGAKLHSEIRNFLSQHDKDLNPHLFQEEGGARVSFGTFSRVELPKPQSLGENPVEKASDKDSEKKS